MRSVSIGLFLVLFYSFFGVQNAYAGNLNVQREVIYWVDYGPHVRVTETVTVTNKQTFAYAKQYVLELDSAEISDVRVQMSTGEPLEWERQQDGSVQQLVIDLPEVFGKAESIQFIASYAMHDSSRINGELLEVRLPKMLIDDAQVRTNTELRVSKDLPEPAFMSPNPVHKVENAEYISYIFEALDLERNGIKAAFGEHKNYQFIIYYHLGELPRVHGKYRLTLPPDTDYQRVTFTDFSQTPEEIVVDADGNWIGEYEADSVHSPVVISGLVSVFADALPGKAMVDVDIATRSQPYWELEEGGKAVANTLQTPEEVYRYVVEHLSYDSDKPGTLDSRTGAQAALDNPEYANCMEFTDVFVALARSAGIPARRVIGYAFSEDQASRPLSLAGDVLHSWPEYWDNGMQQWVPVDPTWEHTSGGYDYFSSWDLAHVSLVLHETSSSLPLPPGYVENPGQSRNIIFTPTSDFVLDRQPVAFEFRTNWQLLVPFLKGNGYIVAKNSGKTAYHDFSVEVVDVAGLTVLENEQQHEMIPPLGEAEFEFTARSKRLLLPRHLEVVVDGARYSVSVSPEYRAVPLTLYIIMIVIYGTAIYFVYRLTRKAWRVSV